MYVYSQRGLLCLIQYSDAPLNSNARGTSLDALKFTCMFWSIRKHHPSSRVDPREQRHVLKWNLRESALFVRVAFGELITANRPPRRQNGFAPLHILKLVISSLFRHLKMSRHVQLKTGSLNMQSPLYCSVVSCFGFTRCFGLDKLKCSNCRRTERIFIATGKQNSSAFSYLSLCL